MIPDCILIASSELLFSVHKNKHLLPSVCHTVLGIMVRNLVVDNNVQFIEGPQSENSFGLVHRLQQVSLDVKWKNLEQR